MFDSGKQTSFTRQFIAARAKHVALLFGLGFISNLLTLAIPISVGRYYELALGYGSKRLGFIKFIPDFLWNTVDRFLYFFAAIVILRFVFHFLYESRLRNESDLFIKELKDFLFSNQINITLGTYEKKGTGKYLLRYTGDINSLKNLYRKASVSIVIDLIMVIIGMYALWRINPSGGGVVLLSILIGYAVVKLVNVQLEAASLRKRNRTSQQVAFVNRILSGVAAVKVFNRQGIELKRYSSKSGKILGEAVGFNKWLVLNSTFIHLMQYSTLLAILVVFSKQGGESGATASSLISFILLYLTLIPALRRVYKLESVLKLGKISESKLKNILQQEFDDSEGMGIEVNNPRLTIAQLELDAAFPPIDFRSKKREYCILKLDSGKQVGKLLDTLTKLNSDYEGAVFINKTDIREINADSFRSVLSVSSTKYPLVGNTVYEAIAEARSADNRQGVEQLFLLFKERFLPDSKLDLDTRIGENGSNLPPAELELLALARGYTNNMHLSKIIVVDKFPLLESGRSDFQALLPDLGKTAIKLDYL